MTGKISAMADARGSDDTLIIARTDAVAVEGFSAAIDRAETFRKIISDKETMQVMCSSDASREDIQGHVVAALKAADERKGDPVCMLGVHSEWTGEAEKWNNMSRTPFSPAHLILPPPALAATTHHIPPPPRPTSHPPSL